MYWLDNYLKSVLTNLLTRVASYAFFMLYLLRAGSGKAWGPSSSQGWSLRCGLCHEAACRCRHERNQQVRTSSCRRLVIRSVLSIPTRTDSADCDSSYCRGPLDIFNPLSDGCVARMLWLFFKRTFPKHALLPVGFLGRCVTCLCGRRHCLFVKSSQ